MTTLSGKTILITGGTSGIGRETAVELAKMGAHIVVTGRNAQRGEDGLADIKARSGSQTVDLLLADLSSQAEVKRMAAEVRDRYDKLDVLVNNVGYLPSKKSNSVDGIDMTLAVNVITPFLLTHELLPLLKQSAPSRVINVTGGRSAAGAIDFDNLQWEKESVSLTHYSHLKQVMMGMSMEFARRLEGTGVNLNVAYPAPANTNMTSDMKPDMVPLYIRLLWPVFKIIMANASPAKAARSSIYLASSADVEGVSGRYFDTHSKVTNWPKALLAEGVTARIWSICEELTGTA